jgi:hypothetical protein
MDPPVVDSTKRLHIVDIEPLLITICPLDQWNETKVHEFGYVNTFNLLQGLGHGHKKKFVGWGDQHNLTFDELVGKVTNFNLINHSWNGSVNDKLVDVNYEIRFYPKHGYCYDLVNLTTSGEVQIWTDNPEFKEAQVYITDRKLRTRNTVHAESHWGSKIILKNGYLEYDIKTEQLSHFDPRNPDDCKKYDNDDYEKCVDEEFEKFWIQLINCNPPWLSSNDQCDSVMNINQTTVDSVRVKTYHFVMFVYLMKYNPTVAETLMKTCKKACTVANSIIYGKEEEHDSNDTLAGIMLNFNDQVEFTTKTLAYGPYHFLIDMGSSLGLWFGLSVFGITDLGIKVFQWIKNTKQEVMRKV